MRPQGDGIASMPARGHAQRELMIATSSTSTSPITQPWLRTDAFCARVRQTAPVGNYASPRFLWTADSFGRKTNVEVHSVKRRCSCEPVVHVGASRPADRYRAREGWAVGGAPTASYGRSAG